MKVNVSKEWCMAAAKREEEAGDVDFTIGGRPLVFEAINWHQVANSLEQTTFEYARSALESSGSSGAAYATASLVVDALKRAIREGLE